MAQDAPIGQSDGEYNADEITESVPTNRPDEYNPAEFVEAYDETDDGYASVDVLHALAVRSPDKKDYIRVHPTFEMVVRLYERPDPDGGTRTETYLVHPTLRHSKGSPNSTGCIWRLLAEALHLLSSPPGCPPITIGTGGHGMTRS